MSKDCKWRLPLKLSGFLFLLPLLLLGSHLKAQVGKTNPVTVTGKTVDENGQPVSGVSIRVKGTPIGVIGREDGRFSIQVPDMKSVLVFTYIGYSPEERPVPANRTINIEMKAAGTALSDVVVVAYGQQKKATVTGAVSQVSGKDLVRTSVSNVSNMLVGNAPGVSGLQTSGEAGRNGANIYIRGISTFAGGNSSQPLVVIDNVEQAPERAYDQLNAMDANEIADITILKDASATAVYGIRGANGVIIVTTKRGRVSKPTLSFSANTGFTKATNLMHNVNSYQYALMRNEAIATEVDRFGNLSYANNVFDDNDLERLKIGRDYLPSEVDAMPNLTAAQKEQLKHAPALYYGSRDLFAEQFGGTGPQKQANVNITGGTKNLKYFASLGYFSQGSILNNTKYYNANIKSTYDRYNFRSNFDINVVKNLQISVNLAGQFGQTNGPGLAGGDAFNMDGRYKAIMQYLIESNPLTAPGLVDGKLVSGFSGIRGSASNPLSLKIGSLKGDQNAIYNLLTSGNETLYNTFLSNSIVIRHTMDYLTKGLSLRGTINYDDNYIKTTTFVPSLPTYHVRRSPGNPNELEFTGGELGADQFNTNPGRNATWYKTYYDAGLDYANTFGDHTVTGLLLAKASKYFVPAQNNFYTPSGVMGFLGRVTYNYKERYLLEVNAGYNGTEQFIEGNRFGLFPAYSAGWVVSNESFFRENRWLTFLKLRGSYGEVGNDQLNSNRRYLYLPSTFNLGQSGYFFGTSDGSVTNPQFAGGVEGSLGNPNVTWERSAKTNAGLDARFLRDKLSVTADYFTEKRTGILTMLDQIIPYAYGVPASSTPPDNVGSVSNKGFELVIGWNDRIGDLSYNLSLNVNHSKNKIEYMAESPKPYPWLYSAGFPVGQYKGLKTDGFYNTEEELDKRVYNTFNANNTALGDVRYQDINDDGLIDYKDIVNIGYSNLPQYTFGFKGGFSYKGFDLNFLLTGTAKGSFNLAQYQYVYGPFFQTAGNIMDWQFEGRWTPEKVANGTPVKFPRATINGGTGGTTNFLNSDLWLISSDYIRLKNIEVGYSFSNSRLLKRVGIGSLRVYGNANNVYTFKSEMLDYGIDPEAANAGSVAIYPLTRVIVFGVNVQF